MTTADLAEDVMLKTVSAEHGTRPTVSVEGEDFLDLDTKA
jgi:hypothetical protein